jgi:integrase
MVRVLVRGKPDRANLLLYFVDPTTGREISRSAGTSDRKEAERAAALWEQELANYRGPAGDGWPLFRDRFRDEHLVTLAPKSQAAFRTALEAFQARANPATLRDVTPDALSRFQSELLEEGLTIATAANYLTHLRAALNWAARVGLLETAPRVKLPRQSRHSFMKGRPVTKEELTRMLEACPSAQWKRMLELLWHSGLRLGEAMALSWDRPPVQVDLEARPYPHLLFHARGQKSRRDEAVPITPEFHRWLSQTPPAQRTGLVAPVPLESIPRVSEAIQAIGQAAGVIVNDDGKPASAHDLRRSFGTRLAQQVMPAVLKVLMRHADISTTLKFYVGITATDAGRALWGETVPANVPKTQKKRRATRRKA